MRRPFNFWERLGRLVHLRLVIPVRRSPHPPEYSARAVAIGLFWAFTPLVGIQMYLVFVTWLVCRRNPDLEFNLIIALAWTWVTNVFTMWPVYYGFYVTGRFLMGEPGLAAGYDNFVAAWHAALDVGGLWHGVVAYVRTIWTEQGLPMALGSIPCALLSAWIGYRWSLKYVVHRRRLRAARIAQRQARRRVADAG